MLVGVFGKLLTTRDLATCSYIPVVVVVRGGGLVPGRLTAGVGDLGNVARVVVDVVLDGLEATVGELDEVLACKRKNT